jgi:hypothetical protein
LIKVELATINEEFFKLIKETTIFLSKIFVNIVDASENAIKNFKYLKEKFQKDDIPSRPTEVKSSLLNSKYVNKIDDDIIEINPDNDASIEKNISNNGLTLKINQIEKSTVAPNETKIVGQDSASVSQTKKTIRCRSKRTYNSSVLSTEIQLPERLRSRMIPKKDNQSAEIDPSKLIVHVFGMKMKKPSDNRKFLESCLPGIEVQEIIIHKTDQKWATLKFTTEEMARRAMNKLVVARPYYIIGFESNLNELRKKYDNRKAQSKINAHRNSEKIANKIEAKKNTSQELSKTIDCVVEASRQNIQTEEVLVSSTSAVPNLETPPLSRSESTNSATEMIHSNMTSAKDNFSFFSTSLYVFGTNKTTKEEDLANLFKDFKIAKIEIKSDLE